MRLLATLSLLKGLGYVNASISAFVIAAFTWIHRPSLAIIALLFLAAAMGCAMVYQSLIKKSLDAMIGNLKPDETTSPEIARSAAQLLYLEGRDDEARKLLLQHFGESPFID